MTALVEVPRHRRDPFARPLDRRLQGLRRHCGPDPYRLIPGDDSDRWAARCPLHPGVTGAWSAYTLVVADREHEQEPELWCRVGCPPWVIRYVLLPDPEREHEAAERARVLVWAQNWERSA
jgi:hypothetical protein